MQNKVKIFLDRANKWFDAEYKNLELNIGDRVLVESSRGLELGRVTDLNPTNQNLNEEQTFYVVRLASKNDEERAKQNLTKEKEFLLQTKECAKKQNLNMKVVDVQISLDGQKIVISFVAEDRVDFRELVKELANAFKCRIELKQIGPRDEVKLVGALGPCGKVCCCSGEFNDFCHVSIKMAKVQNLSLNPTNISGMCGRLMCCLAYENGHYSETASIMPKVNSKVMTPDGEGTVVYNDLLARKVSVRFFTENASEVKIYDLLNLKFDKPVLNEVNEG